MKSVRCEDCKVVIRGDKGEIQDHFSSTRHKQNHEKSLKEKRKESQKEDKHAALKKTNFIKRKILAKEKELNKDSSQTELNKDVFYSKKDMSDLVSESANKFNKVWRRILDFNQNKIIYENQLTGEQTESLPLGIIEADLETIAINSDDQDKVLKWEEVPAEETYYNKYAESNRQIDSENFLQREIETEFEINMLETLAENGNEVGKAIYESIKKCKDPSEKFEKLGNLAHSNLLFHLEKKRDLNAPVETDKINGDGIFRKKKIAKTNRFEIV